ncbi:nucleotide-binding alpha-beta plait domain-containing protein [Tanacetum coccineum]
MDRLRLHANVARFQRPPLKNVSNDYRTNVVRKSPAGGPSNTIVRNEHSISYLGAVKQKGPSHDVVVDNQPSIVLDDSCIRQGDLSLSLMGKVKDFGSLSNLKLILAKEGFDNLNLKYMGGFWILFEFSSLPVLEKFKSHVGVGSWFSSLQHASNSFTIDSRVTWVDIEGVPLHAWTTNTFSKISSKWGKLLYEEDKENLCLNNKRVCINTTIEKNIFESIKIIVKGKIYWVRAKEVSGWVPDFIEDEEEEEYSDEDIEVPDQEKVCENLNNSGKSERDRDVEEVSETVFEQVQDRFTQEDINNNMRLCNLKTLLTSTNCFTPEENVIEKSDFVDHSVREDNVSTRKAFEEKSIHEINNRMSNASSKEEDNVSRFSGHFKRAEGPTTGGSILQLLDDVVKVGQTMGFKMDGCVRNIEEIIDTQGENVFHP